MKIERSIIFIFIILLIFGCDNGSTKSTANSKTVQKSEDFYDEGETECVYSKTTKKLNKTFPFNVADKIEVVSYPCRTCKGYYQSIDSMIVNDKFTVKNIKYKVALNTQEIDTLFSILFDYKKKRKGNMELGVACYSPRHSIVFYQNKKALAFLEICFECFNYRHSRDVDFGEFCDAKYCQLYKFFRKIGIKEELADGYCK